MPAPYREIGPALIVKLVWFTGGSRVHVLNRFQEGRLCVDLFVSVSFELNLILVTCPWLFLASNVELRDGVL